ncbi:MAG: hypothetical protein GAK37_00263 [Pseudomonas sp.]|nr:MAG: hypothetical protein GAK37_00263 [Pseudomonas sp.]
MTEEFTELQQFLLAYFHQDWVDDHDNADEVICSFISDSSNETLTKVLKELDKLLLAEKTEQQLQDFLFFEIGCGYYYPSEWKNGKSWLMHVSTMLRLKVT